jgi:hypothetical protein
MSAARQTVVAAATYLAASLALFYGAMLQGSGEAIRGKLDVYLDRLGQESATAAEGE